MSALCTACQRPTDAFLCRRCSDSLDAAFGDLPSLVDALVTSAVKQSRVHRASTAKREPDQDWRGSEHARPIIPMPVDLDATDLLHRVGNTLVTWARHLAEDRGHRLDIITGEGIEGPVCAGHIHDFTVEGCGHDPTACRQLHPGHVHSMKPRGCGLLVDEDGELLCRELHCAHRTCDVIRRRQLTGAAAGLVRWFLSHRDSIRYDEAAGDMHSEITALADDLRRAVDSSPSPFYAGPCHAPVDEVATEERDGTVYTTAVHKCQRDLYMWPDSDGEIKCNGYRSRVEGDQGCGAVHTVAMRTYWLGASVRESLVTIDELMSVLPTLFKAMPQPPKTVVQAWVRQGRLVPHGINHAGVETFVGGEMLDLIAAYRPKAFAPRPGRRKMAS